MNVQCWLQRSLSQDNFASKYYGFAPSLGHLPRAFPHYCARAHPEEALVLRKLGCFFKNSHEKVGKGGSGNAASINKAKFPFRNYMGDKWIKWIKWIRWWLGTGRVCTEKTWQEGQRKSQLQRNGYLDTLVLKVIWFRLSAQLSSWALSKLWDVSWCPIVCWRQWSMLIFRKMLQNDESMSCLDIDASANPARFEQINRFH